MSVWSHPANARVLELLAAQAAPRTADAASDFDIDGYELHADPDLVERLLDVAAAAGVAVREEAIYGCPALVHPNGVVIAFARGSSSLHVLFDGDFLELDAWQADAPSQLGLERLAEAVQDAWEEADAVTAG